MSKQMTGEGLVALVINRGGSGGSPWRCEDRLHTQQPAVGERDRECVERAVASTIEATTRAGFEKARGRCMRQIFVRKVVSLL